MYALHPLILIHPYARYGMHMSKNKEVMARARICTDRRTEYMTHHRMMMHPCAKYRMPMAKNKEVMAQTRIRVEKLIFLS